MKRASVVIGAAFGDEGKGLFTDYYAAQSANSIVVRFNGGAQAGHTVVAPDGRRHVFSHFGSGSFAGAATFLSEHFLTNPMMWCKEADVLKDLPPVYIDPRSVVTTPYDMLINQFVEEHRGLVRHGSCGMGINETIVRSVYGGLKIVAGDLRDALFVSDRLKLIRDVWVPMRLSDLGIIMTEEMRRAVNSFELLVQFLGSASEMLEASSIQGPICLESRDVVFEGAQGLLLDEEHYFFPHVTRSKTGLKNVISIAQDADITDLDVTYVVRAYMTRHGRGAFPTEVEGMQFEDNTNNPNPWQGTLRFGTLDMDLVGEAIQKDLIPYSENVNARLAITHMDQVEDLTVHIGGHDYYDMKLGTFIDYCKIGSGLMKVSFASGPTRNDISEGL